MEAIEETYGLKTVVCGVEVDGGEIVGGTPAVIVRSILGSRRLVALAYSDYMFPLFSEPAEDSETEKAILRSLEDCAREYGCSSIELRWSLPAELDGWKEVGGRVLHVLKLQKSPEETYRAFGKKFRQYPRKASRNGLRLSERPPSERLEEFYRLHTLTRVKLGVPVQPSHFFLNLKHNVIEKGGGEILLIEDKHGVGVSAAIVLGMGTRAMIKYSASDPDALRSRCHYLLFWKCIEWAHQEGMKQVDFGRSELEDRGLRKFKSGWNADEIPLAYSYFGDASHTSPGGASEKLASAFIRLFGSAGCRLLGKLLYRYAG
jgi:lipid II:glycine glycyltransferase (peptidoglycan interpeptide bridge formation enzyme)